MFSGEGFWKRHAGQNPSQVIAEFEANGFEKDDGIVFDDEFSELLEGHVSNPVVVIGLVSGDAVVLEEEGGSLDGVEEEGEETRCSVVDVSFVENVDGFEDVVCGNDGFLRRGVGLGCVYDLMGLFGGGGC